MENTSGTHLVELFSNMVRICQHCWIFTLNLVKWCNRAIIARDVPPMSDSSKHMGEITVGKSESSTENNWRYGSSPYYQVEDSMRKDGEG